MPYDRSKLTITAAVDPEYARFSTLRQRPRPLPLPEAAVPAQEVALSSSAAALINTRLVSLEKFVLSGQCKNMELAVVKALGIVPMTCFELEPWLHKSHQVVSSILTRLDYAYIVEVRSTKWRKESNCDVNLYSLTGKKYDHDEVCVINQCYRLAQVPLDVFCLIGADENMTKDQCMRVAATRRRLMDLYAKKLNYDDLTDMLKRHLVKWFGAANEDYDLKRQLAMVVKRVKRAEERQKRGIP